VPGPGLEFGLEFTAVDPASAQPAAPTSARRHASEVIRRRCTAHMLVDWDPGFEPPAWV
jgi:hypothetical protein